MASERDHVLEDMRRHCDPQIAAYFAFMFFTGLRPEESIAMRWSDIDFQRRTVRVRRVRTFRGTERAGSKTHAERDVDLVPAAWSALQTMMPFTGPSHPEFIPRSSPAPSRGNCGRQRKTPQTVERQRLAGFLCW
jgi:integrase